MRACVRSWVGGGVGGGVCEQVEPRALGGRKVGLATAVAQGREAGRRRAGVFWNVPYVDHILLAQMGAAVTGLEGGKQMERGRGGVMVRARGDPGGGKGKRWPLGVDNSWG